MGRSVLADLLPKWVIMWLNRGLDLGPGLWNLAIKEPGRTSSCPKSQKKFGPHWNMMSSIQDAGSWFSSILQSEATTETESRVGFKVIVRNVSIFVPFLWSLLVWVSCALFLFPGSFEIKSNSILFVC